MKAYRLLDTKRGFIELTGMAREWYEVTHRAKRHICMDDCTEAHEEYGKRLLSNENVELFHIMEPGKVVTIEHKGDPVYLMTNDITRYNIIHHSPMMCSLNLPSKLTAY